MKRLLIIPIILLFTVFCNGQTILHTGSSFPTAQITAGEEVEDNDLLDNLVFYYDFSESSGNLSDEVSSRTATAGGTPSYSQTGKIGNCIAFSGDDYFSMTEASDLYAYQTDISFSSWVYITSVPADGVQCGIIGGENNTPGYLLYGYSGALVAYWNPGNDGTPSSTYLPAGSWHHVVMTFDYSETTDKIKFYLDGGAYDGLTTDDIFGSDRAILYLGCTNPTTYLFVGSLDEVAMWRGRVLSADNVAFLFNDNAGRPFSHFK
jgi:hypothetical protein